MSDELKILVTLAAILFGAVAFVRILSREDRARKAVGRGVFSFGYSTRLGWVMAVIVVAVTLFLLTRP